LKKRNRALGISFIPVIAILLIFGSYVALSTTPPQTQVDYSGLVTSAVTANSTLGLELVASISPTITAPGGSVLINVLVNNTRPAENNLTAANDWAISRMTLGGCGTINYPFGMAIFSGNYETNNISYAQSPLLFYYPGAYSCPANVLCE
jgi:hypothetical protein